MNSVIEKSKKNGINIYTVSNAYLGPEMTKNFRLRKHHADAVKYATWLDRLEKLAKKAERRAG